MNNTEADIEKYEVMLRYRAIEMIVYWEGRLNTPRLIELFGISRQQASKDMRLYVEKYNPGSLIYDRGIRAYKPAEGFVPALSQGHINEYMDLLTGIISQGVPMTMVSHPYIATVEYPDRSVDAKIVRALLYASRNQKAITMVYASMQNPEPLRRDISPHTLIYTGFRWHIRGYCHKKSAFRDFNLSRIFNVFGASKETFVSNEEDRLWHEDITFSLVPSPLLSEKQKQLVEKDFSMQRGKLKVTTKKALVHYTLQRYQAAIDEEEQNAPLKSPLVINPKCHEAIKPFLFTG